MNQARRLTIGFVSLIAIVLLLCSCPALAQGEPVTSNEVYLSNEGSDDNSGTEEAPVKTFARAKELLATDGTIYIIDGMLTVSDSQSWSLEGYGQATVKRAGGSTIVELTEGASLTLEHIILDGGIEFPDPDRSGGSLITSDEECTLVLGDGCVLRNNSCNSHGAAVAGWEKMHLTMKPGAVIEYN